MQKKLKISTLAALIFAFILLVSNTLVLANNTDSADLNLVVQDNICIFNILVKPEKRIPSEDNWSTLLSIEVSEPNGPKIATINDVRTDNTGAAEIDICEREIALENNTTYNFYIKGLSHLRKYFSNFSIKLGVSYINDFTGENKELLAGETSGYFDNYINSLDLSTQALNFRKTNGAINEFEKNDLNRDGIVNGLDISNTAFNFRKSGD